MKVWITKYVLTKGIYEVEVRMNPTIGDGQMVSGPGVFESYHGEGRDWHRTREAAVKHANVMRVAKIRSLQKSIAKFQDPFV